MRRLTLIVFFVIFCSAGLVVAGPAIGAGTADSVAGHSAPDSTDPGGFVGTSPPEGYDAIPGEGAATHAEFIQSSDDRPALFGPEESIDLTYEFDHGPTDPFVIEVSADVPAEYLDRNGEFALGVTNVDTVETDGFSDDTSWQGYGYLTWDGETTDPTATIEVETISPPPGFGEEYTFYMDDEWALANTGIDPRYTENGHDHSAVIDVHTPEDAAVGSHMTYVGPHKEVSVTAGAEDVRLILPAGSTASETDVTAAIEAAGEMLRVGPRADEVLAIAAQDPLYEGGLAYLYPQSDLWTHEAQATEVWIHEYVHTRQAYADPAVGLYPSAEWLVEAEADYLPFALQYERDEYDFEAFQDVLNADTAATDAFCRDTDYENVVLANPQTWSDTRADYCKGRLVVGALDGEIRAATDGDRTYADVMRRFNDPDRTESLTMAEFQDAVEAVADEPMDDFFDAYVYDTGIPDPPESEADFGGWSAFDVGLNGTVADDPVPADAEVTVPVNVTNEGDDPAIGVEARLEIPDGWTALAAESGVARDGVVAWDVGELGPDETLTDEVVLRSPVDGSAAPTLRVTDADGNEDTAELSMSDRPTITVEGPRAVTAGESVRLEADVENDIGEYEVVWTLPSGETVEGPVLEHTFDVGEHDIEVTVEDEYGSVATESHVLSVEADDATDEADTTDEPVRDAVPGEVRDDLADEANDHDDGIPGFGVGVAIGAIGTVLIGVVLSSRRIRLVAGR